MDYNKLPRQEQIQLKEDIDKWTDAFTEIHELLKKNKLNWEEMSQKSKKAKLIQQRLMKHECWPEIAKELPTDALVEIEEWLNQYVIRPQNKSTISKIKDWITWK